MQPGIALALLFAATAPVEGRLTLESVAGELEERPLGPGLESLGDVVWIGFRGFPRHEDDPGDARPRVQAFLAGGDRLVGRLGSAGGDDLEVVLPGESSLDVSIDAVDYVVLPGHLPAGRRLERPESGDRVLWVRPEGVDTVDGTLESFETEGVRFDSDVLGQVTFPWNEVAAIFVEVFEEPEPAERGPRSVAVDLLDGGRLSAELERVGPDGLAVVVAGQRLVLPLGAVRELVVDDGRLAYLSALEPLRAEEGSPFGDELGMTWPHRIDEAVTGEPLRAGGRTWSRGIGAHAPSRITWALDGGWRTLRGEVAVDDSVLLLPHEGSVRFIVRVDGKERWNSGVVRGGEPPLALPPIDLAGARELELELDMATDFHVADRGDWLRMRLFK